MPDCIPTRWHWPTCSGGPVPCEWIVFDGVSGRWFRVVLMGA